MDLTVVYGQSQKGIFYLLGGFKLEGKLSSENGTAKAILYGGILIMLGHILLAMPIGMGALFASIALITLGTAY
ncbi:hypothetical protein FC84_GL000415 [Lapidilactobacillus dextrinicus DSM 20335]|uniref:Uncharacterized protein n=1 Tax=Lapidilactobacillus dextrinicus DSM 20335 TaxID=1423738 RepID=A0A0R2BH74_9LACO|nr:hypothetical protein FC84_GL000415 [Lapidilactobacillus dextrinicus DSM 20335]